MDIKLKYRAWVGEKHADIASPLTNSDIETYATEFAEWLVKNLAIPDVSNKEVAVCPECGYPTFKRTFDSKIYCHGCDWEWQTDC